MIEVEIIQNFKERTKKLKPVRKFFILLICILNDKRVNVNQPKYLRACFV